MSGRHRSRWVEVLLIVVVLCGAGAGTAGLMLLRTEAPKQERKVVGPLVETQRVSLQTVPLRIEGHGSVEAQVRAQIIPQVSGRVVALHENMVSGGFIPAGETILQIDREDYELAVATAEADLQQAQANQDAAEAAIAEAQTRLDDAREDMKRMQSLKSTSVATQRELDKVKVEVDVAEANLRATKSQMSTAKARYAAAQVALNKAKLNLKRTTVTMPFGAVVINEDIDKGQYVTPGQSVGQVYGTDAVEIPVPLEDNQMKWLSNIPLASENAGSGGSIDPANLPSATVSGNILGKNCVWTGKVVRAEGQLDERSRMIHLVVRVEDPFADQGQPPLLPGAFVDVSIEGQALRDVAVLPRHALRGQGEAVWVVRDDKLRIEPVQIARTDREQVYIDGGLRDGDQVVVSALDVVTDGMLVRTINADVAEAAPEANLP